MKRLIIEAEKGNANAQFNLGILYDNQLDDNGHPSIGNRADAIAWLLRAANQGQTRAQSKLAEILAEEPDVKQSYVEACTWFQLAVRDSIGVYRHRAQKGLDRVSQHMTAAQIARATHLAKIWKPTIQVTATAQ